MSARIGPRQAEAYNLTTDLYYILLRTELYYILLTWHVCKFLQTIVHKEATKGQLPKTHANQSL